MSRYQHVCVESFGLELPEERVATAELEARLAPVYAKLGIEPGHVEALTGIHERRVWPRGTKMAPCAAKAAERALANAGLRGKDVGAVVYAGVCRDQLEPATACAVADALGVSGATQVYDVSNACLGMMSAIVDVANRIELGQIECGVVVASESSRDIVERSIAALLVEPTIECYRRSVATLTGGSAAAAIVLTRAEHSDAGHRLTTAVALTEPRHHSLCRWGPSEGLLGETLNVMATDAREVLTNGLLLGRRTFAALREETGWRPSEIDCTVSHQVGAVHRREVLAALELAPARDPVSFDRFGNTGSVSIALTAALGEESGAMRRGQRVAFLGIGSGLNCTMLGFEW